MREKFTVFLISLKCFGNVKRFKQNYVVFALNQKQITYLIFYLTYQIKVSLLIK